MVPEQNISRFLERYNREDRIHQRSFNLILESFKDRNTLLSLIDFTILSGTNVDNLKFLLETLQPDKDEQAEEADFESRNTFGNKFGVIDNQEDLTFSKKFKKSADSEGDIPGLFSDENSLEGAISSKADNRIPESNILSSRNEHPKAEFISQTHLHRQGERSVYSDVKDKSYSDSTVVSKDSNIKHISDTVLYNNMISDINVSSSIDLNKDADPAYLFPVLQCKLCGLRFRSDLTEEFGHHIEDHRRYTNALGDKVVLRREFFSSKTIQKIKKLELSIEDTAEAVVWEKASPACMVCKKIIKKVWDDKLENWVLDNGVKINEKQTAHKECVS